MTIRKTLSGTLLAGLLFGFSAAGIPATVQARTTTVNITPGVSMVKYRGAILGDQSDQYLIPARAGETLKISIQSDNRFTAFNVTPPGGSEAIFVGLDEGNFFEKTLSMSGEYLVTVFLARPAARRGESGRYELNFTLAASHVRRDMQPGFADGLAGGPDFWIVRGVQGRTGNNRLNVHNAPSRRSAFVASLAEGAVVRNLGSRMVNGERWSHVALKGNPRVRGWVQRKYLREY